MDEIKIDEDFQMYTIIDEPDPNIDTMFKNAPESTKEAMEEAGIE